MSINEIEQMLNEIGIQYNYHHFDAEDAIEPPFMVYVLPDADGVAADGTTYIKIKTLDIEVYTDSKNEPIEEQVEGVLDSRGIRYKKSEVWIESELMYEVLYEMEV